MRAACVAGALSLAAFSLSAPGAQAQQIGAWMVQPAYDGDGPSHATAILMADDGSSLVVSCDAKGLSAFVSYLEKFPDADGVRVRWRVAGAAHDERWAFGPDRSTLAPPGPAAGFLKQLERGPVLTIRVPGHQSTYTLTGVRQVGALLGRCGS